MENGWCCTRRGSANGRQMEIVGRGLRRHLVTKTMGQSKPVGAVMTSSGKKKASSGGPPRWAIGLLVALCILVVIGYVVARGWPKAMY